MTPTNAPEPQCVTKTWWWKRSTWEKLLKYGLKVLTVIRWFFSWIHESTKVSWTLFSQTSRLLFPLEKRSFWNQTQPVRLTASIHVTVTAVGEFDLNVKTVPLRTERNQFHPAPLYLHTGGGFSRESLKRLQGRKVSSGVWLAAVILLASPLRLSMCSRWRTHKKKKDPIYKLLRRLQRRGGRPRRIAPGWIGVRQLAAATRLSAHAISSLTDVLHSLPPTTPGPPRTKKKEKKKSTCGATSKERESIRLWTGAHCSTRRRRKRSKRVGRREWAKVVELEVRGQGTRCYNNCD